MKTKSLVKDYTRKNEGIFGIQSGSCHGYQKCLGKVVLEEDQKSSKVNISIAPETFCWAYLRSFMQPWL